MITIIILVSTLAYIGLGVAISSLVCVAVSANSSYRTDRIVTTVVWPWVLFLMIAWFVWEKCLGKGES